MNKDDFLKRNHSSLSFSSLNSQKNMPSDLQKVPSWSMTSRQFVDSSIEDDLGVVPEFRVQIPKAGSLTSANDRDPKCHSKDLTVPRQEFGEPDTSNYRFSESIGSFDKFNNIAQESMEKSNGFLDMECLKRVDCIREKILYQEKMFSEQVWELHNLVQVQILLSRKLQTLETEPRSATRAPKDAEPRRLNSQIISNSVRVDSSAEKMRTPVLQNFLLENPVQDSSDSIQIALQKRSSGTKDFVDHVDTGLTLNGNEAYSNRTVKSPSVENKDAKKSCDSREDVSHSADGETVAQVQPKSREENIDPNPTNEQPHSPSIRSSNPHLFSPLFSGSKFLENVNLNPKFNSERNLVDRNGSKLSPKAAHDSDSTENPRIPTEQLTRSVHVVYSSETRPPLPEAPMSTNFPAWQSNPLLHTQVNIPQYLPLKNSFIPLGSPNLPRGFPLPSSNPMQSQINGMNPWQWVQFWSTKPGNLNSRNANNHQLAMNVDPGSSKTGEKNTPGSFLEPSRNLTPMYPPFPPLFPGFNFAPGYGCFNVPLYPNSFFTPEPPPLLPPLYPPYPSRSPAPTNSNSKSECETSMGTKEVNGSMASWNSQSYSPMKLNEDPAKSNSFKRPPPLVLVKQKGKSEMRLVPAEEYERNKKRREKQPVLSEDSTSSVSNDAKRRRSGASGSGVGISTKLVSNEGEIKPASVDSLSIMKNNFRGQLCAVPMTPVVLRNHAVRDCVTATRSGTSMACVLKEVISEAAQAEVQEEGSDDDPNAENSRHMGSDPLLPFGSPSSDDVAMPGNSAEEIGRHRRESGGMEANRTQDENDGSDDPMKEDDCEDEDEVINPSSEPPN